MYKLEHKEVFLQALELASFPNELSKYVEDCYMKEEQEEGKEEEASNIGDYIREMERKIIKLEREVSRLRFDMYSRRKRKRFISGRPLV